MKKWEKFSKEELEDFVKESYSYAELAEKLGYSLKSGSGQKQAKEICKLYNFSTEHFSQKLRPSTVKTEQIFIKGYKSRETLRKNLIVLRGHKCEYCGLDSWNNLPISLQVHHKDGDSLNNLLDNLELLCPNCHAQTENYCGKNKASIGINEEEFVEALRTSKNIHQALVKIGKVDGNWYPKARELMEKYDIVFATPEIEKRVCPNCGKPIARYSANCLECAHLKLRVSERPSREELKGLIRTKSFCSIAREYNVSDNAIRKWCKAEKLPYRVSEIKSYSDEEWGKI